MPPRVGSVQSSYQLKPELLTLLTPSPSSLAFWGEALVSLLPCQEHSKRHNGSSVLQELNHI